MATVRVSVVVSMASSLSSSFSSFSITAQTSSQVSFAAVSMSDYFSLPVNSLTASHAYSKFQPQSLYREDKQTNSIFTDSQSYSSFSMNPSVTTITSSALSERQRNRNSMLQGSFTSVPSVPGSVSDHSRSFPLAPHYAVDSTCSCADLENQTAATCSTRNSDFGNFDANDASDSAAASLPSCNRCTTKPHVASLERSYVTHAAVGRVECNSKGCRPILDDRWTPNSSSSESTSGWNTNVSHDRDSAHGICGVSKHQLYRRDARSHFSLEIAQLLDNIWTEKDSAEKWFEAAITEAPFDARLLSAYAKFAWKELKDMDKAESLFKRAVDEAPDNAEALAGYALFLWDHEAAI